ncbi:pentatricopeptide repeat-containing protein At5g50280, chloroplastic [Gastrolobium bilobum]|uniref:pentatricopeptide repeat-containing protein At5g50280, chloroplastic n=1 Tax=Gastrolobium bilobum TaxID=150636 RepID=UPI002AB0E185|nr:pentatricopeptide repeat-containing protein At5g50280, chloroplastic [Gastrolobium bilobum]
MALSLIHHKLPLSSSNIFFLHPSISHHTHPLGLSKPCFLLHSKTPTSSLSLSVCLCASPSNATHSSTTPIFLQHLQQQEQEQEQGIEAIEEEEEEEEEQEQSHDPDDPIYKFFKTRTWVPSQDPGTEGKLTIQKNRRISWHLAPEASDFVEEAEMGSEETNLFVEEKEEMGFQKKELPEGVVGEIVQLARNLPQNLTLEEALAEYEGRVSDKECWQVLELLGEEHLLVSCLYFFQWMRLQEPSLVTPRACTLLFPLLGRAGMGEKLMLLFRNLPSSKEFRDVHVYNAAISGLLSCARYEDAWKVYESMETDNIRPDHVTCSITVTVMRKIGRSAKDAWQFFEKMNRKGVRWSEEVLGALIKSFCSEGLMREALIIQSEMEKKGVSSNAIVYNTLMDAYCKSNHVEEAEGLFVEMKAKGIKPTAATFNILMHAYSRRMQHKIVEKLLAEMQDVGLKPNAHSYTCLISAYGKQKDMSDMAADAFLKMKKVGIKPTSHSYTAMIHAYSVSGLHEKAYAAFENMQREGIKPSIETYTALLDAFRRAGDTQTLMKIWKSMRSEKVEGTLVTFNTLVDGFAKQGHFMEARDVISEFGKVGLHPTVITYNMLMNAYARGGQHSKLPQLLKEMAVLKLKPDSVTYSTMIYAFIRVRDFKRAFFYHKKMIKSGQVMDSYSYQKLRDILDVKAKKKNKKDRRALAGIIHSKMGIVKAKTKKDEFWKDKKRHVKTR